MNIEILDDFPYPPKGKTGWPWNVEKKDFPNNMPNAKSWPKISIVTPSYNQGEFLEETIRSVLLQGYPNLEYIVIDGGSTDNSVEIIKKYEEYLFFSISEIDTGQSNAINKGLKIASGDIISWINSDDYYNKNTFLTVAKYYLNNEFETIMVGQSNWVNNTSKFLANHNMIVENFYQLLFYHENYFLSQPSVFFDRSLLNKIGYLDEELDYTMDLEFWLRVGNYIGFNKKIYKSNYLFSYLRSHKNQKTTSQNTQAMQEVEETLLKYAGSYYSGISYLLYKHKLKRFRFYKLIDKCGFNNKYEFKNLVKINFLVVKFMPLFIISPYYYSFNIKYIYRLLYNKNA